MASALSDKSFLAYDLLREAPMHLREGSLPITELEDVVALFDTTKCNSGGYLPQAIMLYQLEVCSNAIKIFD